MTGVSSWFRMSLFPTLGYVCVGLSAFALLAVGPRALGPYGFSQLALTWTLAVAFGSGLAVPAEQTVNRAVAAGESWTVAALPAAILGAVALVPAACALHGGFGEDSMGSQGLLALSLAAVGWVTAATTRGALAGLGCFSIVGWNLCLEAVARIALVAGAALVPSVSTSLLYLSVGLPLILASLCTAPSLVLNVKARSPRRPWTWRPHGYLRITLVAVSIQVILNSAPVWISMRNTNSIVTGQFVSAAAYMRIPIILAGGLLTVLLSVLTNRTKTSPHSEVSTALPTKVLAAGAWAAIILQGILLLFAPLGLRLLYGPDYLSEPATLLLLGCGTIVVIVANLATQGVFASRRFREAALAWTLGALLATLGLAKAPPTTATTTFVILVCSIASAGWLILYYCRNSTQTSKFKPATSEEPPT